MRHLVVIAVISMLPLHAIVAAGPATFDEPALRHFLGTGTGEISGVINVRAQRGEAHLRAGSAVVLTPRTPWTMQGADVLLRRVPRGKIDSRLAQYQRLTRADAEGRFAFHHLPPGDYYITCVPRWQLPDENATISAAVVLYAELAVRDRETTRVVVR